MKCDLLSSFEVKLVQRIWESVYKFINFKIFEQFTVAVPEIIIGVIAN